MPSLLNTSLSGLRAYQGALSTVSNNIANVGNEDYTRQRVEIDARNPIRLGNSFFGQGSELSSITRVVDGFVNSNIRGFVSNLGRLEAFDFYASRVEGIIADEQAGLMPALDGFFNAMNDVANNPSANAPRVALIGAIENVQQRISTMATELENIEIEINNRISNEISEINVISEQIAEINGVLTTITDAGNQPSDLLDKRDALLKQLSEKITVTVVEQANGNMNVLVGTGQLLVTNASALTLVARPDARESDKTAIAIQSSAGAVNITQALTGGELGGLLDFRDNLLDETQNNLGRTAIGLSESVNALHVQGYDLNGDAGTNIFSTVSTGPLQGQFGGDYLNNGFDALETVSFNLQFDGRTITPSYTLAAAPVPGNTNQSIADGLLFGVAGIVNDPNVTDNLDGTYTLAGTTPGVSMTFELYGTNIKFESAGGPGPVNNNLIISGITDGGLNDAQLSLASLGSSSTRFTAGSVTNASAATFIGPITQALPNLSNTGTGVVNYSISDAAALTISDYEVRFDGTDYQVFRLSDNAQLATIAGAGPFSTNVDGIDISVGGVSVLGDSYFIRPTKDGATNMRTLINDPARLAMASPVRSTVNVGNLGSADISQATVTDATNGNLTHTVDIFFNPATPGAFDVIDRGTTPATTLQTNVAYFNGITISENGWQVQLTGKPLAGDVYTVQNNANAVSDNRNALALSGLQIKGVLDGGNSTFEQSYNSLVSKVGVVTQQVKINRDVDESLLRSAIEKRESISGVNLDEEAADLIRFQQAYQALSRVISTSQQLFESLIAAV
jgi:flagellar hook-associated protein 1